MIYLVPVVIGRGREFKLLVSPIPTENKERDPNTLRACSPNKINSLAPVVPEIKSCSPYKALNETTINPVSVTAAPV